MKSERAFDRAQLRNLGRQIRSLREHRGLSLNQLARQSGISVTGIRNIEFGRANPGLLTVVAILDVLGLSLDELVSLARRSGKTVHVARAPAAAQRDASVQRPISEIYQPRVRGRMVTLPAGTDMLTVRKSDAGPHFAFVLEGQVRVSMGDGKAHELGAGDAIHLADQPPRVIANAGVGAARLLWVKDSRSETRIDASLDRGR